MTVDEAKKRVLALYPEAVLVHRKPGVNQYGNWWTVQDGHGNNLGTSSLSGEDDAWLYAASRI